MGDFKVRPIVQDGVLDGRLISTENKEDALWMLAFINSDEYKNLIYKRMAIERYKRFLLN